MKLTGEKKITFLISLFIIAVSCSREAYNISYNGVIVDEETNCPVPLSSIQSSCLFQKNIDESGIDKINTTTDSLGQFKLQFDKGYQINLAIKAEDYLESTIQFNPVKQTPDTIFLKRKMVLQSSISSKENETTP